ncbi:hypothetical protein IL308_05580 [Lactococcus lactis]|uniref:hypothetical protein n=1 Tax=Lactococcus lactis TaxID=1358 RepID=UPI0019113ABB|nr:hypothetical protein [Lactococcus lactis]MBK5076262.1 hypothetical protein [Lactococcus lactis]WDA68866.1 hypothetical protein IL310_02115 [Lactococcus lactis]
MTEHSLDYEVEREYERVYKLFDERCCLDWADIVKIRRALRSVRANFAYLKKQYPQMKLILKKYENKANVRFEDALTACREQGLRYIKNREQSHKLKEKRHHYA